LAQRQAGQLPENTPTPNSLANYVRPNARLGVSGMAAVEEIAVASDHNILARADKSDAKGLATLERFQSNRNHWGIHKRREQ